MPRLMPEWSGPLRVHPGPGMGPASAMVVASGLRLGAVLRAIALGLAGGTVLWLAATLHAPGADVVPGDEPLPLPVELREPAPSLRPAPTAPPAGQAPLHRHDACTDRGGALP